MPESPSIATAAGSLAARCVVLGLEDPAQFKLLLETMLKEFDAQTFSEFLCVEEMAVAKWKSHRIWAVEKSTLNFHIDARPADRLVDHPDAPAQVSAAWTDAQKLLDNLAWHDTRLQRQFNRALGQLQRLQGRRRAAAKKQISENEPEECRS